MLALLQAEAADVADRPDQPAMVRRQKGLRAIFDDLDVVFGAPRFMMSSMSQGLPKRCVTMIALVRR